MVSKTVACGGLGYPIGDAACGNRDYRAHSWSEPPKRDSNRLIICLARDGN